MTPDGRGTPPVTCVHVTFACACAARHRHPARRGPLAPRASRDDTCSCPSAEARTAAAASTPTPCSESTAQRRYTAASLELRVDTAPCVRHLARTSRPDAHGLGPGRLGRSGDVGCTLSTSPPFDARRRCTPGGDRRASAGARVERRGDRCVLPPDGHGLAAPAAAAECGRGAATPGCVQSGAALPC